jgi:hypothetical protein
MGRNGEKAAVDGFRPFFAVFDRFERFCPFSSFFVMNCMRLRMTLFLGTIATSGESGQIAPVQIVAGSRVFEDYRP